MTDKPPPTDRFFGRAAELTQLLDRLVDPAYRLVTLVGAGGIGKTRLAVEVGRQLLLSFPDGVWFVGLDGVRDDTAAIQIAIGAAACLEVDGKQLTGEQVIAILREKRLLLILDNCETVLEALEFVPLWLRRAPHVALLATSREPLNFQAESVVQVDRLPPPAAAALFAERARMARDDFALSAENQAAVDLICRQVDGSPLGIALAAAWVRRRSLAQIGDAIDRSLDFLTTRLRDVDPRHRSMRAVLETSWQLLMPEHQAILAALSVFPAAFSAEAAAAVAGAALLDLDELGENRSCGSSRSRSGTPCTAWYASSRRTSWPVARRPSARRSSPTFWRSRGRTTRNTIGCSRSGTILRPPSPKHTRTRRGGRCSTWCRR